MLLSMALLPSVVVHIAVLLLRMLRRAHCRTLCIDLPSQRLPRTALHCAALQSSWTRIGRRRCRVSGRHCCCLARLGAPGGCSRDQAGANRTPGSTFYCAASFWLDSLLEDLSAFNRRSYRRVLYPQPFLKLILNMVVMNDLKASKLHERAHWQ